MLPGEALKDTRMALEGKKKSFFVEKLNNLWSSCGFQEAPVTLASVKGSDMLEGSRDSFLWRSTQGSQHS